MTRLGGQESSGNADITNVDSGAHGTYQILPDNWPSWAREAGLPANAPQTPENQYIVARHKIQQLYGQYGNWEDVAAVWYSGRPRDPNTLDAPQGGGKYPTIRQYITSLVGGAGGTAMAWQSAPITQGFGPTDEPLDGPYNGYAHFNKGLDFAVPVGTPIDSPISGTVVSAGDSGDGWGISVKVRDANGFTHNFGHLSAAAVQPGQTISAGTVVGKSGNTGHSTGPHLSYDVSDSSGAFVDPSRWTGGGSNMAGDYSDFVTRYSGIRKQWKPLNDKIAPYVDGTVKGDLIHVPGDGIYANVPKVNEDGTGAVDLYGNPVTEQILVMTEQEYSQWEDLGGQLADLEHQYEAGGGNLDDAIKRIDFQYETDPRNIDAANTADRFAREMDVRTTATSQANQALAEQNGVQSDAVDSFNKFLGSSTPGSVTMVPRTKLPTQDDLFQQAIDRVSKGLPEVTDRPYYGDTTLPTQGAGEGGAAGLRLGADAYERTQLPKPKGLLGTVSGGITSTINNVKSAISTAVPGRQPTADFSTKLPSSIPATAGPAAQAAPMGVQSPAQRTAAIAGSIFSYFR